MDDARDTRIKELLQRLGKVIHAAVVDSDEVNNCLAELHSDGWDAVMFLEASILCRSDGDTDGAAEDLKIHVDTNHREAEYQLDSADARWLDAIGISPTKHRSHPKRALPPLRQPHPPAHEDG